MHDAKEERYSQEIIFFSFENFSSVLYSKITFFKKKRAGWWKDKNRLFYFLLLPEDNILTGNNGERNKIGVEV